LGAYSQLENHIMPELFSENLPTDTYSGTYRISTTGDTENDNDIIPFSFKITEDYFSCAPNQDEIDELGLSQMVPIDDGFNTTTGNLVFYAAGTAFYNFLEGSYLDHVRFGVTEAEQTASGIIHVQLYELPNGDDNLDNLLSPNERILVASNSIVIDTVETKEIIDIPLWWVDNNETHIGSFAPLKENTNYVVVFLTESLNGDQIDLLAYPSTENIYGQTVTNNWNHDVAREALRDLGSTQAIGTYFEPMINGTPEDFENTSIGAFSDNTLYNEIYISQTSGVSGDWVQKDVLVYPNPAKNNINISIPNKQTVNEVEVLLIDINGRIIFGQNYNTNKISINTEDIQTGHYLVRISSEIESISKKLVIIK